MNQGKDIAVITHARIKHVSDSIHAIRNQDQDYFVLTAVVVVDAIGRTDGRTFVPGKEITTSKLVRIDIEKNEFETKHTVYKLVRESEVAVYQMCIPT
jgi:hypothetical protein